MGQFPRLIHRRSSQHLWRFRQAWLLFTPVKSSTLTKLIWAIFSASFQISTSRRLAILCHRHIRFTISHFEFINALLSISSFFTYWMSNFVVISISNLTAIERLQLYPRFIKTQRGFSVSFMSRFNQFNIFECCRRGSHNIFLSKKPWG